MKILSIGFAVLICINSTLIGRADEPDALSKEKLTHKKIEIPAIETPKQAVLRGCKVMENLDLDQAVDLYEYHGDFGKQNVKAACRYYLGLTRVELAVRNKFGMKADDDFLHAIGENTEDDARNATYKVDGDKAEVTFPGDPQPSLQMIRENGVWKVDVSSTLQSMSKEDLKKFADFYESVEAASGPLADKINQGDFQTVDQVVDAFKPLLEKRPN